MSVKDLATKNSKDTKKAWPLVRLGDVCESFNGLWKGTKQPLKTVGVIRSTNFTKQCEFDHSKIIFIEVEETKFLKRKLQCGDIVVERSGGGPNQPVGRVLLFDIEEGDYTISNFTSALRIKDKCALDSSYLHRVLVAQYFSGVTAKMQSNATNIINLHYDEFLNIEFPLPPLTVQREIVARLEKELGEADKLAAKFKRVAELADDAFKADAELADDAFKAELDETFMAVEGEKVRLGDVCVIQRGGSPRPIKKYLTTSTNGLNWIKIGDVASDGKYIVSVEDKITPSGLNKTRRVKAGDFLLSNSMSFGRPYILKIDGCIHDGWLVLHGFQDKFSEDYFYYLLRSSSVQIQFDSLAHGSSVRNLNTSAVSSVEVSITSLPEQRTIVAKLDAAKERCEKLKAAAMRGLAAAENLRKAILAEAFE